MRLENRNRLTDTENTYRYQRGKGRMDKLGIWGLQIYTTISIKKQRHYFARKDPSSQSCGFPVAMYGYESWTIKKAEYRRIDAFELWC